MAELNVHCHDLIQVAGGYQELAARAALIAPQAAAEVQRIADTHGLIGYPAAVGIVTALINAEGPLVAKVADLQTYSQRFAEHAATYTDQDAHAATSIRQSVVGLNSAATVVGAVISATESTLASAPRTAATLVPAATSIARTVGSTHGPVAGPHPSAPPSAVHPQNVAPQSNLPVAQHHSLHGGKLNDGVARAVDSV